MTRDCCAESTEMSERLARVLDELPLEIELTWRRPPRRPQTASAGSWVVALAAVAGIAALLPWERAQWRPRRARWHDPTPGRGEEHEERRWRRWERRLARDLRRSGTWGGGVR
jgi:hypothetical protein